MRTMLTMLGMIIGVGAVITMVALGKGAQSTIEAQVKAAGTNMITVMAGNFSQGGVRQGGGMATTLTVEDAAGAARRSGSGVPGGGRAIAGAAHCRQPELVEPDSGHRRRSAADSQLADEVRQLLHGPGRQRRAEGGRARADRLGQPVRAGRRSDRADHPGQEPAVQGARRPVAEGLDGVRAGSGRRRLRAVHDGPEEAPGHPAHQQHLDLGRPVRRPRRCRPPSPKRCARATS